MRCPWRREKNEKASKRRVFFKEKANKNERREKKEKSGDKNKE